MVRPTSRWPRGATLGLGAAVVLVVVLVLGLAVGTRSGDSPTPRADSPRTSAPFPAQGAVPESGAFDVDGTLEVASTPGQRVSGDARRCTLPPELSDLGPGTRVILTDPTRRALSSATLAYSSGTSNSCTFAFTLEGVPPGLPSYTMSVSGRGGLDYSESELRAGVAVTLGG